jgi:hypothetical protein
VTLVPSEKLAVQTGPQLMPPGKLVTVPAPVPALTTVNVAVLGRAGLNVAVTV